MKKEWNQKKIGMYLGGAVAVVALVASGLFLTTQFEETSQQSVVTGKAGIVAITSGDKGEAKKIVDDGIFTMITRSMGQNINPIFASQEGEKMAVDLIFEPLARRDKDGIMYPILAESIVYDESGLSMTVQIKNDILFSDGTALAIDDVIMSLLLAMLNHTVGTEHVAGLEQFFGATTPLPSGLQIISDDTICITFDTLGIQNEQILEIPIQKMTGFDFNMLTGNVVEYIRAVLGNGIGTNSYQLVENNSNSAYLEANDHYREEIQSIREIQIHDVNSVYLEKMIEAQVVDYIYFGSQDTLLQTFIDDLRYAVYGKETTTLIGLMVNESMVPMKNYYIRQAIHHAIDRRTLLPEAHWYRYKPVSSIISGSAYLETDDELASDINQAKSVFEMALNVLNKESFYITLPIIEGNELYESVAAGVKEGLEKIGMHVNVKPQTTDAYIDSLYLTNDYDLYLEEVTILGTEEDYTTFAYEYFETFPEIFDSIWQDIAKAVTDEEKLLAYQKANEMMQKYSLLIPVARGQNFIGVAASWSGYEITPYTNVPENLHQCIYG